MKTTNYPPGLFLLIHKRVPAFCEGKEGRKVTVFISHLSYAGNPGSPGGPLWDCPAWSCVRHS